MATDPPSPDPDALFVQLQMSLHQRGTACARIDDLDVPAADWQAIALVAGAEIGRPVATTTIGGAVYAVLRDWPANAEEKAQDRAAIDGE